MDKLRVGVGIYVIKDGKFLLMQRRKGSHGQGQYATPGGHMEYMESFSSSALRELAEECGLQIKVTKPRFVCLMNLTAFKPKHYVHISMTADYISGEPQLLEPAKGEEWKWYPLNKLPSPLFISTKTTLKALKTGNYFFE